MTTIAEAFTTIRPDLSKFTGELKGQLGGVGDVFKKTLIQLGIGASIGAIVGGSIRAAMEEQVGMERLAQAIENTGRSMGEFVSAGKTLNQQLEETLGAEARLSGFSDGELREALSTIVAITGDFDEAMERLPIAMDFARGSGQDLATTSRLLAKVTDETTNVLQRYGIRAQKGADATEVLRLVQQKFSGQAARFGQTAAGSWATFTHEVENLKEEIGFALLPLFTKFIKVATDGIVWLRTNVIPQLTQAFKALGVVIKPIFDLLGFGWKTFAAPLLKFIADLLGSIGEVFDVLTGRRPEAGGVLRDLIGDEAAEGFMHTVANVREALKEAFDFIKPIIQGAIDKVAELKAKFDELPPAIRNFAGGAAGALIVGPVAVGVLDTLINIVSNTLSGIFAFTQLGKIGGAVFGKLGFGAAKTATQLALFPTPLAAAAAGFKAFLVAAAPIALVVATIVLVVEAILQVKETVELVVKNWDKVMILWHRATDSAGAAIRGVFESVGSAVAGFFKGIGAFFSGFGSLVSGAFAGVGNIVGGFFSGLGAQVRKALDFWVGVWQKFAESPARAIGFAVGVVIGGLIRIGQGIREFGGSAIRAVGEFAAGLNRIQRSMKEFSAGVVSAIVDMARRAWAAFDQWINFDMPAAVVKGVGDMFNTIGTFTNDAVHAFDRWTASVGETIGAFFEALPARLGAWLGEAVIRFVAFKDETGRVIGDTVAQIGAIIGEFFTALPGRMFRFGVDMLLGFLGGAKSMFGTVKATVTEFFEGVVQGVKAVLDAHSPSGVFRDIGEGMMLGLAEGIDKNANLPQMAMPDLQANVGTAGSRAPFARAPITVNVGPLTLNYTGPASPEKVRQMGADTLDYITQGLSDQFNRLAAV